MPSKSETEKTNMVFLAGTLKFDPKKFDNNLRALIDVGLKSAIQVSVYTGKDDGKALAAKLNKFKEGDFIKLVATLRPYGVKDDDGNWKNNVSIDVTEIKNDPPKRNESHSRQMSDDDIPF